MQHFRSKSFITHSLLLLLILIAAGISAAAQTSRGSLNGTVTDKTGAALAHAPSP
jgi:hypothetical protein